MTFTVSYSGNTPTAAEGLEEGEYFLENNDLFLDGEVVAEPNSGSRQLSTTTYTRQAVMKEYERDENGTLVSWVSREFWTSSSSPNNQLTISREATDAVYQSFSTSGGLTGVIGPGGVLNVSQSTTGEVQLAQRTQATYYGVLFTKTRVERTKSYGTSSAGAVLTTSGSTSQPT